MSEHDIPGILHLDAGHGNLPRVVIANGFGVAHVYLHGAHVTHWQPKGHQPVLWLSRQSLFAAGKPIRGGIPICWPWFGAHATDKGLPGHGTARLRPWAVTETMQLNDGRTRVVLALGDAAAFAHPFRLTLAVTVGTTLEVALTTANTGDAPFAYEDALHAYFTVGDVRRTTVEGLDGVDFIDKTDGFARRRQTGDLAFAAETDRVHLATAGATAIVDPLLRRRIAVAKDGSRNTVVWNPWAAKATAMADFGDEEWTGMLCVEAANCGDQRIALAPGTQHTTTAILGVESL